MEILIVAGVAAFLVVFIAALVFACIAWDRNYCYGPYVGIYKGYHIRSRLDIDFPLKGNRICVHALSSKYGNKLSAAFSDDIMNMTKEQLQQEKFKTFTTAVEGAETYLAEKDENELKRKRVEAAYNNVIFGEYRKE